jgi:hypothetical protein
MKDMTCQHELLQTILGFTITSLRQSVSMQWKHPASHAKKKFKVTPSSRKVMFTVFWDHEGILLTAFQPQGQAVNADSYCNILRKLCKALSDQDSPDQGSLRLVPTAVQRIVCCWFSRACETMGQLLGDYVEI